MKLNDLGKLVIVKNLKKNGAKNLLFNFTNLDYFYSIKNNNITINNIILFKKEELHLTLIGNRISSKIFDLYENKEQYLKEFEEVVNTINNLISNTKIELIDNYTFLKKEKENEIKFSLIKEIQSEILENVYKFLSQKYNFKFSKPYPHVTLYKQKENIGIGIDSIEDFNKYKLLSFDNLKDF